MTIDQFREIRLKAGGLIVLLPKNLLDLSLEEKEVSKFMKAIYKAVSSS